ncbi:class I SAM-dependent RNA methyltransferase [Teichococcus cervicalis]|uniref:Putative 23S rRNA (Uracil-5-)-methyltransferase RumA n=1 Tax=Pseudoroseomonas cervicalis ATCC 49957 TaxID=525371 RepID=D5RT25_9PROT|nr:class I SAM-dependent RNA methyltransferase [Pseudoroseomonas cervicalis]EFH09542.1 putative 23S rRNA (uracil-5-)-methyltransferase RumA [Pseudoroseomonas cervicalis ATCC 49957]
MQVTIEAMGAAGDGIATAPDGNRLYLPYTLPGEAVRPDGPIVLSPSPERVAPPCPHFGPCGGCVLQHWAIPPYADWKRARLAEALSRAGFPDAPVAPTRVTPPATRRRADLAVRRRPDGSVVLGFHARGGAAVEDLSTCHVLDPALVALFEPLRTLLRGLPAFRREGSAVLNLLDSGPDLLLRLDGPPGVADRATLAAFAARHGLPRIAGGPLKGQGTETLAQLGPVSIAFAGASVAPPPGAFLQATPQGEAAIVEAVLDGLPKLTGKARIVELHAGLGTLSFPLAAKARVIAYEGAPEAVAALDAAARRGGAKIQAVRRDLVRQPLSVKELEGHAALVLDPPFAGAAEQIPALAKSTLSRVIYVSCNPVALARDAKLLHAAGFRVQQATPVDQFLWSAQLEAVVVFARGK